GQLAAAAYPAQMLALLISDVPGDDPAFIGSGPTVGDASTCADVKSILERYKVDVPQSVQSALSAGSGVIPPGDTRLSKVENVIYAAPSQSLNAASLMAQEANLNVRLLGDALEGEARDVAKTHADMALDIQKGLRVEDKSVLLLSGGELTVTRRGDGVGGPNAEYCLALALALNGADRVYALACDTDGVDGAAEVAGAVIGPRTLVRAEELNANAETALAANDAHSFFETLQDQVVTGPTLTNVNDFRALLIMSPGA
ncbi:MAG: MOFRL family protein, partial [Pseudomonadota bacterium]